MIVSMNYDRLISRASIAFSAFDFLRRRRRRFYGLDSSFRTNDQFSIMNVTLSRRRHLKLGPVGRPVYDLARFTVCGREERKSSLKGM